MANLMKRVHDLSTNEITDTEMTDAEQAAFLAHEKEQQEKANPTVSGDE